MTVNSEALYAAFKAKDTRFDGRFFVGISSTGIYCRPVCRAKRPKFENCMFFATAAEAEGAGYRPCLLCRPELAPGSSVADATSHLVHRAARMIEENCGSGGSLAALAEHLGCSDRHLRRAFQAELHVSPVAYLQTCRLLLAKQLLTDTDLPVIDVAMAAGFGSLRRFNDLFKSRYNLSPTALRKRAAGAPTPGGDITLALGYRPPYGWEGILRFLDEHTIAGLDAVRDGEYLRTVRLAAADGRPIQGWIKVAHRSHKHELAVTLSESLLPVLPQVLARVRQLFDLGCDPGAVGEALRTMAAVQPGLPVPGARLPGCFDPFELSVRTVLGQQITMKAAGTLAARLVAAYGTPADTGIEGLTHLFPAPGDILALEGPIEGHLGPLGVIAARSRTIYALAEAFAGGTIDMSPTARPEESMQKLLLLPGIGPWTAGYIAMRALSHPDAFLPGDYGVKKALEPHTPKEIAHMAEDWRPYRSYAVIHLWSTL